jgi:hypothetical protein
MVVNKEMGIHNWHGQWFTIQPVVVGVYPALFSGYHMELIKKNAQFAGRLEFILFA